MMGTPVHIVRLVSRMASAPMSAFVKRPRCYYCNQNFIAYDDKPTCCACAPAWKDLPWQTAL